MKVSLVGFGLLASSVSAIPVHQDTFEYGSIHSVDNSTETMPWTTMTFTGPVFVGGPNETFTGSAKSVYQQIMKRNPSYDAWSFPDYAEEMALAGITKASFRPGRKQLSKRDTDWRSNMDNYDCDSGADIDAYDRNCQEGIDYLHNLGANWCSVAANARTRVSCSHKCGMWLGNRQPKRRSVRCGKIAQDITAIAHVCGIMSGAGYGEWDKDAKVDWHARGRVYYENYYVELSRDIC